MVEKKTVMRTKKTSSCDTGGAVYGLGFLGAAVYYIFSAPTILLGLWGFVKALLWPAFLVYEVLKYVGA